MCCGSFKNMEHLSVLSRSFSVICRVFYLILSAEYVRYIPVAGFYLATWTTFIRNVPSSDNHVLAAAWCVSEAHVLFFNWSPPHIHTHRSKVALPHSAYSYPHVWLPPYLKVRDGIVLPQFKISFSTSCAQMRGFQRWCRKSEICLMELTWTNRTAADVIQNLGHEVLCSNLSPETCCSVQLLLKFTKSFHDQ